MSMRIIALYVCLLMTCFICGARETTIMPQFTVGDTIGYRATTSLVLYHGKDSLVSTAKLLPTLIVNEKNDKGFVITTNNRLEDFSIECSEPEAVETLKSFDKSDMLNDFVAAIVLKIQLGVDCRPDSILNMNAVRERITEAVINMFLKQQKVDESNRAESENDTRPLLVGAVDMICTPAHLIEQQFGNLPYFNLTGIPLKSGKIPTSMIVTGDILNMCHGLKELDMEITPLDSNMESGISANDGMYSIRISGKKDKLEVEGLLLYSGGIMTHGILTVKMDSDSERLVTTYALDIIK